MGSEMCIRDSNGAESTSDLLKHALLKGYNDQKLETVVRTARQYGQLLHRHLSLILPAMSCAFVRQQILSAQLHWLIGSQAFSELPSETSPR